MKSNLLRRLIPVILVLAVFTTTILYLAYVTRQSQDDTLQASGTVEVVDVEIAAELGGRVANVLVEEGQYVFRGEPLLQIDDELYQAQKQRSQAALNLARVNLETAVAVKAVAQANLDTTQAQYQVTLIQTRSQSLAERIGNWKLSSSDEIDTPVWYFDKSEEITAAREEVDAARQGLADEESNFDQLTAGLNFSEFTRAETRLAVAQAAFLVAKDVLDQAEAQRDSDIRQVSQDLYDTALAELESAQSQYNRILSNKTAQEVIEARARLAVARQRQDIAQDHLDRLLTGEDSPGVQVASLAVSQALAGVEQAETGIRQAQQSIEQAQADIDLINVQIAKLTLYAPLDGIVMTCNVEVGEVVQPAASLMMIGQLDDLTITVFIAEDRYGEIYLGQPATVTADSFPGEHFEATVIQIASQAEYTPRNVQTEEGRRTTVFAIKLAVRDPQHRLKPGMPADVTFDE